MENKDKPESSINAQYSYYNSNPFKIPQGFAGVGFYVQQSRYWTPVNSYSDRIFNKPANIPIHMPVDYGVLRTSDKENKTDK